MQTNANALFCIRFYAPYANYNYNYNINNKNNINYSHKKVRRQAALA